MKLLAATLTLTSGQAALGNECSFTADCQKIQRCQNIADASCVCNFGNCIIGSANECHESSECAAMEKCKGKECSCQGNTCEWQCDTTADCKDHLCNKFLGYKCKCESSICEFEKKTNECSNISDCIRKKLCSANKSCQCNWTGYCEKPWWANEERACRNDQDCENSLGMCVGRKCSCKNIRNISEYEKRGTCQLK